MATVHVEGGNQGILLRDVVGRWVSVFGNWHFLW